VCARSKAAPGIDLAALREAIELIKLGTLADRPHTGRHRTAGLTSELDEPQARARVIATLRANGVDIARAPSEALSDFIESCAAARRSGAQSSVPRARAVLEAQAASCVDAAQGGEAVENPGQKDRPPPSRRKTPSTGSGP
jgi:hypothetical protein